MPLKLSELVNETAEASFEAGGETVNVTFWRHDSAQMHGEALSEGRITEAELNAAAKKDADPFIQNAVLLATRLKGWDWQYLDGEGTKPLPLNTNTLRSLRGKYFQPLWEAVFGKRDEAVPSEPSPSANGS